MHRAFAVVLFASALSACAREKPENRLDGKMKASLVRRTRTAAKGPTEQLFVRVETTPPFEEQVVNCEKIEFAEDDAGKNIAFRCSGKPEWTVLRLRGGDRHLRECDAKVGTDPKPRFGDLKPVSQVAAHLLDCDGAGSVVVEIARSIQEDEGAVVAGNFLASAADRKGFSATDAWHDAWAILSEPGKKAALDGLCGGLHGKKQTPTEFLRAATHCDVSQSGRDALATFQRFLTEKAENEPMELALLTAGVIAGAALPAETGKIACDGAIARQRDRVVIAEILGHTHTACPAIKPWLEPIPCGPPLDCGDALCTDAELAKDVARWNSPIENGGKRAALEIPNQDRATLRAAYALGPLSADITIPNARRRYKAIVPDDAKLCTAHEIEPGAPCECQLREHELCGATPDAGTHRTGKCLVTIDDKQKQVKTTFACEKLGAKCDHSDYKCCEGLECSKDKCVSRGGPPDDHP